MLWTFKYMNLKQNIRRILREEFDKSNIPTEIIEYVYEKTPINNYGSLDDYINYVNDYYQDYYITKHSSPNTDILKSDIQTPEQRGIEKYNSVDGFFVTRDLNPYTYSSSAKKGEDTNYYIMIPKSLNFLQTDYNFSNIPDFYKGFKITNMRSLFKYNGDKVRELGYDVIVPEGGKHEWIVVNPNELIVLGSKKDAKQFSNR